MKDYNLWKHFCFLCPFWLKRWFLFWPRLRLSIFQSNRPDYVDFYQQQTFLWLNSGRMNADVFDIQMIVCERACVWCVFAGVCVCVVVRVWWCACVCVCVCLMVCECVHYRIVDKVRFHQHVLQLSTGHLLCDQSRVSCSLTMKRALHSHGQLEQVVGADLD